MTDEKRPIDLQAASTQRTNDDPSWREVWQRLFPSFTGASLHPDVVSHIDGTAASLAQSSTAISSSAEGPHPCEKDLSQQGCITPDRGDPGSYFATVHCLSLASKTYGNVSQACLNELDVAVPFLCSVDITRFRCHASEQRLLHCLEDNEAALGGRCRDSLSLARDHFIRLHQETKDNYWTPRVQSTCKELMTAARQKGCGGMCVEAAGDWVGRRRVHTASKRCHDNGHVLTELTKSGDELQLFGCCPLDLGSEQRKLRMAAVTRGQVTMMQKSIMPIASADQAVVSSIDLAAQTTTQALALLVIVVLVICMVTGQWTPRKILGLMQDQRRRQRGLDRYLSD